MQVHCMATSAIKDTDSRQLALRGWPHKVECTHQEQETAMHLSFNCVYAKEVREKVAQWTGQTGFRITTNITSISARWATFSSNVPKQDRRELNAVFIYSCWNIWKERNSRTFRNEAMDAHQVFGLIQQQMQLQRSASHIGE